MCEICSKLTIKTPLRLQWRRSGIFIVNFKQIWLTVLVFHTLHILMQAGTKQYWSKHLESVFASWDLHVWSLNRRVITYEDHNFHYKWTRLSHLGLVRMSKYYMEIELLVFFVKVNFGNGRWLLQKRVGRSLRNKGIS